MVYMAYFTHGIQAIILSQNQVNFYTQWGYADAVEGAAASYPSPSRATGFGKMLTVWIGGEFSDRIGRKKMAMAGGILYILCFAGLLFSTSFPVACVGARSWQAWPHPASGMRPCTRRPRSLYSPDTHGAPSSASSSSYPCPVSSTRCWPCSSLQQATGTSMCGSRL